MEPIEEEKKPIYSKEFLAKQSKELEETFNNDLGNLIFFAPFYGQLLNHLRVIGYSEDDEHLKDIAVAAVNYKNLFLKCTSVENLESLEGEEKLGKISYQDYSINERLFIICHEVSHLIFEHVGALVGYDAKIANIAMDVIVNHILVNYFSPNVISEIKGGIFPIQEGNNFFVELCCEKIPISNPDEVLWNTIYDEILQYIEKKCKNGCSEQGASKRKSLYDKIGKALKNQDVGDGKEGEDGEGEGKGSSDSDKINFRYRVQASYANCKSQGTVPAGMERYINSLTEGKIYWTDYLRNLLKSELAKEDYSPKPNMRKIGVSTRLYGKKIPPPWPQLRNEILSDVYLFLDTSGSMSPDDISQGLSEFKALRSVQRFPFIFACCDAEVYDVKIYENYEEPDFDDLPIAGGGGTSFRPIFNKIDEIAANRGKRPALMVLFTDTMGDFPEEAPDYPCIFVTNYKNARVPWGHLVSTV